MLKRPRAPSPSPTRPDPSSPPPLNNNAHLPITKRRRTVGPVIDSTQRRDEDAVDDDGEDDYEDDAEDSGASVDVPQSKDYEHVNHFLHGLHAEYQHRSHAQSHHFSQFAYPVSQHAHMPAAFSSHRNPPSASSSPIPSPTKHARSCHSTTLSTYNCEHMDSQYSNNGGSFSSDRFQEVKAAGALDVQHEGAKSDALGIERSHVMHRYEETNRLLGSLVLSRRRTLGSPSMEPE